MAVAVVASEKRFADSIPGTASDQHRDLLPRLMGSTSQCCNSFAVAVADAVAAGAVVDAAGVAPDSS